MAIKSIPPSRKPRSPASYTINVYRAGKRVPHYTRMHTSTLEGLLLEAQRLESEQVEVVKLLPYDDELERLDKLQRAITQLKHQIPLKGKKKST